MKKLRMLCFFSLFLAACSKDKEQKWKLVWSDEFDYTGLPDSAKWGNEVGFIRNNELQYYTQRRIENSTVEWDKDSIKWILDGAKYHVVSIKDSVNSTSEFHKPFCIILNLAIGGNWPKDPDETTQFPATVYVDYVRVYQKN